MYRFWVIFGAVVLASTSGVWSEDLRFPDDFVFGAGTSAYQVEGAWNVSDKGESIWDHFAHTRDYVLKGETGDVSTDSYHNYERDVEMLRELGVDFYRFSISWTRILPKGFANKISEDGIAYYNKLIDELLKHGIQPYVTLYHWDLPQRLQDLGGFANPLIEEWFADYARVVFEKFGDRVKVWFTFNEPISICLGGYSEIMGFKVAPAVESAGVGVYLCSYHLLRAHARAWRMYDEEFRPKQKGRVSLVAQIYWIEAATNLEIDTVAVEPAMEFVNGLFQDPVYSPTGDYSKFVKDRVAALSKEQGYPRSRLPTLSPDDIEYIKGTYDFFSLNYYTSFNVMGYDKSAATDDETKFTEDASMLLLPAPDRMTASSYWLTSYPAGIRKVLNWVKSRYNVNEILITENGWSTHEEDENTLEDDNRINYFRKHLEMVLLAMHEDGINVIGYSAWSLMDNFQWTNGFGHRFGLYEVDYSDANKRRVPRLSALRYRDVVRTRTLERYEYSGARAESVKADRDHRDGEL